MAKNSLSTELLTWEREKARLFAEHPGKYVLIKGEEVIGIYDTQAYGIREGWTRFPHQPIFVHLIEFEEPRSIPEDHGTAVRVEIEWGDGTVQIVRGADAERYMEIEGSASFMAANHGMRFKPLPWEYRKMTSSSDLHLVAPFSVAAGDDGAAVLDASGSCVMRMDAIRVDVARFLCGVLNSAAARQEK